MALSELKGETEVKLNNSKAAAPNNGSPSSGDQLINDPKKCVIFNYIYQDVFTNIFVSLPFKSLIALSCVSTRFTSDPDLLLCFLEAWQEKMHRHFPQPYSRLTRNPEEKSALNYKSLYQENYKNAYGAMEIRKRKLFNAVKDNALDEIKKTENLNPRDFFQSDSDGSASFIGYAASYHFQSILNHLYSIVLAQYKRQNSDFIDISKRDASGVTLLYWASVLNQKEAVKVLITAHPGLVNIANSKNGATPLCGAAYYGHFSVVEYLLQCGANVDPVGVFGRTPFILAALMGHLEIVKYLRKQGANGDKSRIYETTPLFFAAYQGHFSIVEDLLQHGANVDQESTFGRTPLMAAALMGHLKIVKYLLEQGVSVDKPRIDKATPLTVAVEKGHFIIVKHLLECKATIDPAVNVACRRPLSIAVKKGYVGIVNFLVQERLWRAAAAQSTNELSQLRAYIMKTYPCNFPYSIFKHHTSAVSQCLAKYKDDQSLFAAITKIQDKDPKGTLLARIIHFLVEKNKTHAFAGQAEEKDTDTQPNLFTPGTDACPESKTVTVSPDAAPPSSQGLTGKLMPTDNNTI